MIGPVQNDALLAKAAATVDALSNGRLTLGRRPRRAQGRLRCRGVAYHARGRRLSEQLAALRVAMGGRIQIGPRPVQPGGPELLVGGLNDSAYARAARYADGYIHGGGPPRAFALAADKARAAWADAGGRGSRASGRWATTRSARTEAEAGTRYLLDYYAFTGPFAERIAAGLLTTPQSIVQFIRGYAEAGCDHLVLFPTTAHLDQLDRLADVLG